MKKQNGIKEFTTTGGASVALLLEKAAAKKAKAADRSEGEHVQAWEARKEQVNRRLEWTAFKLAPVVEQKINKAGEVVSKRTFTPSVEVPTAAVSADFAQTSGVDLLKLLEQVPDAETRFCGKISADTILRKWAKEHQARFIADDA